MDTSRPAIPRRAFLWGSAALAVTACTGGDSPPAPVAVAPPTPPASKAPTVVWTLDTIADLVPTAPPRTTTVGSPVPPLPAYDVALGRLGEVVERYATDPANPWALAHGLLARGPELRVAGGGDPLDALVSTWAELHLGGGRPLFAFPRTQGEVRVEPHADLILKTIGEVGYAPDTPVTVSGQAATLADLYRYTLLRTFLVAKGNHASFLSPNDTPWTLQALAQWAPASELQWIALDDTPMDLDDLATFVAAVLTQESAWMFEAMQKGEKFQKAGQNLFSYTCGGAHLLQGAAYAAARGFGTDKAKKSVEVQVPLWFYRLPVELEIYDKVTSRNPAKATVLLAQRLKFLGHFVESLGKMMAMGQYTATREQSNLLEGAVQNLTLTVEALHRNGSFDQLDALKTSDPQLFLDLVGDAAHAIRGVEIVLGRGVVRW